MTFKQRVRRMKMRYEAFVEKQGFPMIITVCVAVIILSAVWSGRMDETLPVPTAPLINAQEAAQLQQESLRDVSPSPTASPEPESPRWQQPLEKMIVIQRFQQTRMNQAVHSGIWQVHDAVDLQANYGEAVLAIADGNVIACTQEGVLGLSVTIDHGDITATYAGLSAAAGLRPQDPVKAGQTIGFAGCSMLDESEPTHLHLKVERRGTAVDPMLLWPN